MPGVLTGISNLGQGGGGEALFKGVLIERRDFTCEVVVMQVHGCENCKRQLRRKEPVSCIVMM